MKRDIPASPKILHMVGFLMSPQGLQTKRHSTEENNFEKDSSENNFPSQNISSDVSHNKKCSLIFYVHTNQS